jgi:hypothetical protein
VDGQEARREGRSRVARRRARFSRPTASPKSAPSSCERCAGTAR